MGIGSFVPLACGGPGAVSYLQWQTIRDARAKDQWDGGCAVVKYRRHRLPAMAAPIDVVATPFVIGRDAEQFTAGDRQPGLAGDPADLTG
jgi:hypothetical protein